MTAIGDRALAEPGKEMLTARLTTALIGERGLFLAGTIAIALHIVDDSFLQPEAGTSAADHLVSGLVPLVALLVAAWAYPRLRPGLRGTVAILLGTFGVVAGASEGAYHTITGGPSADDYTGLLALLAGLLLVGLGVATLWRTRRLEESRSRRYIRRALLGVVAAIVGFEIVFPILVAYGYTNFGRSFEPEAHLGVRYETWPSGRTTG